MNPRNITAVLSLSLALGCASSSNFHTAKPLGKGNTEALVAVSLIQTMHTDTLFFLETPPRFLLLRACRHGGLL